MAIREISFGIFYCIRKYHRWHFAIYMVSLNLSTTKVKKPIINFQTFTGYKELVMLQYCEICVSVYDGFVKNNKLVLANQGKYHRRFKIHRNESVLIRY